jgi:hypothetical protein
MSGFRRTGANVFFCWHVASGRAFDTAHRKMQTQQTEEIAADPTFQEFDYDKTKLRARVRARVSISIF